MAHPFRYLIAFACFVPALLAQAPRTGEQPVHFTVFSARPITDLSYVPRPNAPPAKLVFYPTARSPHYDFRGGGSLHVLDGAGGVVAEVTVPPEIRDALLLFTPIDPTTATAGKGASSLKYRVAVLDDGAARHTSGGLAVINLSSFALSGTIDGKAVTLQEGLNATQAVGTTAKIALHTTVKGRTYQSYTESLKMKKNERALLILFPPFNKGSLEVQSRMLIDEPPAAPAAGAPK